MFRDLQRIELTMLRSRAWELLQTAEYGVLSTIGEDGYPYGVQVNFVCLDESIYFHSALSGHKVDNMQYQSKVSFCVTGRTKLVAKELTTKYESVIAFGVVSEVKENSDQIMLALTDKYFKNCEQEAKAAMKKHRRNLRVYQVKIMHLSGKVTD